MATARIPEAHRDAGRSFRHRFEGPFFRRLFLAGIRHIPVEAQRRSMPLWAGIFHALVPAARRAVEANLTQVLEGPTPEELRRRVRSLFVYYAQSLSDMYAFHLSREVPIETLFLGREHVEGVIRGKRGLVTVTGHLGAWPITPFLIGKRGELPPMTMAMAEEPNRAVGAFEEQFRARFRIVYTTHSPFALLELAGLLRKGEIVGMQLDRHLGGPQAMLPFCGRLAAFPLAPATLARSSGCPIVPVFSVYADRGRRQVAVHYGEPIEVERTSDRERDLRVATERVVAVYQRFVRRYPDQWFNFYDFWAPRRQAARRA
jgi:KDO2-lipid IV(A) lauroyltransferase